MKKLLFATLALVALALPAQAAVFNILAPDPTSQQGNFSLTPGAGPFTDQVTFSITGPSTFTIANATNTFAGPGDEILNWAASIWDSVDGIVGNAGDVLLFGPQAAQACGVTPNCQIVGGSGFLDGPSLFYAQFTGTGSGTSGYSGNISTVASVPIPAVGAGLPGLVAAMFGAFGWYQRRRKVAHS